MSVESLTPSAQKFGNCALFRVEVDALIMTLEYKITILSTNYFIGVYNDDSCNEEFFETKKSCEV